MQKITKRIIPVFLLLIVLLSFDNKTLAFAATISLQMNMDLPIGGSQSLILNGTTEKPVWTSSNKEVATVSADGRVNAFNEGTATITAALGTRKYQCIVTVKENTSYQVKVNSDNTYKIASGAVTTAFQSGQNADLALSSFGINKAKNSTTFNHLNGIATDGTHFFVCDSWNNRVLVYNSIPSDGKAKPAYVLGQASFTSSKAGYGLDEMNWPVGIATANGKLYVADTHNNRILVWNTIPVETGTAADYAITQYSDNKDGSINWPWAIWTNGDKMIVTNTREGQLIIWNAMPTKEDTTADIVISTGGTPRTIISDGNYLLVGDHNINEGNVQGSGSRVWTSFPINNEDTQDFVCRQEGGQPGGCIVNGKLVLLNSGRLFVYNKLPKTVAAMENPSLTVGNNMMNDFKDDYYYFGTGDYNQCLYANGTLFAALYNSNKIVAFKGLPTKPTAVPDYVLGGTLNGSSLLSNGLIMNPNVATDGKSLVAVSDFDWTISIWKSIPDSDNAKADVVYTLDPVTSPKDVVLFDQKLIVATDHSLLIWSSLPTKGQKWTRRVSGTIGSVNMKEIDAIAMDSKYFYISDKATNKIYIYDKIPYKATKPVYIIKGMHGNLQSNGKYLTVTNVGIGGNLCREIYVYDISDISKVTRQSVKGVWKGEIFNSFNNATDGFVTVGGQLVVTDANEHCIYLWNSVSDAVNGVKYAIKLGQGSDYYSSDKIPGANTERVNPVEVAGSNSFIMPTFLAYDGKYLWVGEYKFSSRLLRFSGVLK
jgi:hypothetical protein